MDSRNGIRVGQLLAGVRRGAADGALDLHGFGLVLLEMLTGRQSVAGQPARPHGGSSSPVWLPRVLPTRIPPHIAEVIRRCTSPKLGEGFADIRAVRNALSS